VSCFPNVSWIDPGRAITVAVAPAAQPRDVLTEAFRVRDLVERNVKRKPEPFRLGDHVNEVGLGLVGDGKVGWVKPQAPTHRIAVAFLRRKQGGITSLPHRLAVVGDDLDRLEPRRRQFCLDGLAVADDEDETVGRGDDFGHRLLGLGKRDAFQVGQEGLEVIGRQTELGDLGKGGGDSGGRLEPLGIAPRLGGSSLVDLFGSDRPGLRERVELLEDLLKRRRCGIGSHGGRDAPDALAADVVPGTPYLTPKIKYGVPGTAVADSLIDASEFPSLQAIGGRFHRQPSLGQPSRRCVVDHASVVALPYDDCHSLGDADSAQAADCAITLDMRPAVERRRSFANLQNSFTIGLDERGPTFSVGSLYKLGNGLIVEKNREPLSVVANALADFDARLLSQQ